MQSDEMRTLDIPVGLLHLRLKIDRVRQALVQQGANFNSAILRYVILCFVHLGLWCGFVNRGFHICLVFCRVISKAKAVLDFPLGLWPIVQFMTWLPAT